jgi:Type II secretion system (T2SS), protein E, N-terminal domain
MAQALLAAVQRRVSLVRALLDTEALTVLRLEEELARTAPDTPLLRHPVPVLDLAERLPPHLCAALVAVPVRADALTGTVDVAVADASDAHAAEEIGFYLNAPVRLVRSPLGAIESAIDQVKQARQQSSAPPSAGPISVPPPSPVRPVSRTPPWGMPAYVRPEEPALGSERPLPLISKPPFQHSQRSPESVAERAEAFAAPGADIPVPLLRRLTPGAGLVALSRAAQELEDEEDPVVELRHPKPSSNPPRVVLVSAPAPAPAPARAIEPGVARPPPAEDGVSAPPSTSLSQLLREMTKVTARDPLMELVLLAVRPTAHKSALFAVKKDVYAGWMCTSEFGDRRELAQIQIDARKASLLAATAAAGTYVGPLPRNETHAPLAKLIRSQAPEVLGVAIRAAGKSAVVLIAHDVLEPLKAMTVLSEVARVAGETLEKILRAKR